LVFLIIVFSACSSGSKPDRVRVDFFEPKTPLFSIGNDSERVETGNYAYLLNFAVDEAENIYVADKENLKIDRFDKEGNFIRSFGGVSHESASYHRWFDVFTVDPGGNLMAYSGAAQKILIFSSASEEFRQFDLYISPKWYALKMKVEKSGGLLVLGHSYSLGYQLIRFDLETKKYAAIHTDNRRVRPSFQDIRPDFDMDAGGNIYITDSIEYLVYKYSPAGRLVDRFQKRVKKNKMEARDFNILTRVDRVEAIPNYRESWEKLEGVSGYFPAMFGISIDNDSGRIYVWSSDQDPEKRFLVDVYDLNFSYKCTGGYYNIMGNNHAVIFKGKFYVPNIGSDDEKLKSEVGRFGVFQIPYRLDVFRISWPSSH